MFRPSVCRIVIGKDRTFCRFPRKKTIWRASEPPLLYGGTERRMGRAASAQSPLWWNGRTGTQNYR